MEGALCHCGQALELGFSTFTLQEWRRGSLSTRGLPRFAAQSRGGGGVAREQNRSSCRYHNQCAESVCEALGEAADEHELPQRGWIRCGCGLGASEVS